MTNPPAVELKYHAQTLRLLGAGPRRSPRAVAAIGRAEARCGRRLPAAVREWYSLEGAVGLLTHRDGDAGPVSLAKFLRRFEKLYLDPPPDRVPNYWAGRGEVPNALRWAIRFYDVWSAGYSGYLVVDGTDDPPVEQEAHPREKPRAPFGEYVRSVAWTRMTDRRAEAWVDGGRWYQPVLPFGPPHLDFLAEHFEELPREVVTKAGGRLYERWPAEEQHHLRFFRPGGRVAVSVAGGPAAGVHPASWSLYADTGDQLLGLYELLWPCRAPGAVVTVADDFEEGLADRFRGRFPDAAVRG